MKKLLLILLMLVFTANANLFSDTNVYGYFQVHGSSVVYDNWFEKDRNQFDFQQMNLFITNNITDNITAIVNFEYSDDYDTRNEFGYAALQEAYINYEGFDGMLKIKAGKFIPKFGILNEISNRTPLLPYVIRPMLFEIDNRSLMQPFNFYPQDANFQIYGDIDAGDMLTFNYAAFMGNIKNTFWEKTSGDGSFPLSTAFQYGGRAGVDVEVTEDIGINVGGSFGLDKDGFTLNDAEGNPLFGGNLDQTKIGVDALLTAYDLTVSFEYLMSNTALTSEENAMLAADGMVQFAGRPDDIDKTSFYVAGSYDLPYDTFIYGFYSEWGDHTDNLFHSGLQAYSGGAGYRVSDNLIVKYQFHFFTMPQEAIANVDKFLAASPDPVDNAAALMVDGEKSASLTNHVIAISVLF